MPAPRPVAVTGRRLLLLGAPWLAAFTATLDNTVVAVALRDLQVDLSAGVAELQGVVTAYTVALAALLLTGGALTDVLGRRRVLAAGLAVFAAASVGCALAGSPVALIAWRAVQGAGAALVLPASLAVLVSVTAEGPERARAVGVWAASAALALVAGPMVGGLLVAAYGWPAVFWVNVPLSLAVGLALFAVPQVPAAGGRRLDLPGQLLAALALAAAAFGVVLLGRGGHLTSGLAAVAAAVLAGALLVAVERRSEDPLLPRGATGDPALRGAALSAFVSSVAVFVLLVFLSLFLQLVQEQSALGTALRLMPLPAALVAVAVPAARWAAARGPAGPVAAGLAVAAAGLAGLAARLDPALGTGELLGLLLVVGVGLGLTTAPAIGASLEALRSDRSGAAGAVVSVARELGGVVAVAGLGAVVVSRLGADAVARLQAGGAPADAASRVVDVLLGGSTRTEDLLAASDGAISPFLLLDLTELFSASYVSSVRVALAATAAALLLAAVPCFRLLRRARTGVPG